MMMNGDEVFVIAGPLDGTSPFVVSFEGSKFSSIDTSNDSDSFADPSFSLISDGKPDYWGTDTKLKMKVGVVSVTKWSDATRCQQIQVATPWRVPPWKTHRSSTSEHCSSVGFWQ